LMAGNIDSSLVRNICYGKIKKYSLCSVNNESPPVFILDYWLPTKCYCTSGVCGQCRAMVPVLGRHPLNIHSCIDFMESGLVLRVTQVDICSTYVLTYRSTWTVLYSVSFH